MGTLACCVQDWGRGPEANWAVSRDIITWRRNGEARCLKIGSQSVKEKTMTWQGCMFRKIGSGGPYLWFIKIRTVTLNAGIWYCAPLWSCRPCATLELNLIFK
jgi:hypothetical protein